MDLSKMNLSSYLPDVPYQIRELFDKATSFVMNYSEAETKVVEATNDEPWGPAGKLLQELSQLSFSYEHYHELIGMLWKRCFQQDQRHWRRTYKALLVLTYLIKNGHEKVIVSTREHLYDLRNLENFTYRDENGKDQGINIRHKVKDLIELLQDEERIREERRKARANRDKYIGMSNESSFDHHDCLKSKSKSYSSNLSSEIYSTHQSNSGKQESKKEPSFDDKQSVIASPEPIIDLLGDDDEFGQFQEAKSPCVENRTSNDLTSVIFDPFGSIEPSTDLFQSATKPSNEFDLFSINHSIVPPINQQLSNSYSLNTIYNQQKRTENTEKQNAWSSAQGKLDISLNNLLPYNRGNNQKPSLTLNQLTSPMNSSNTQPNYFN